MLTLLFEKKKTGSVKIQNFNEFVGIDLRLGVLGLLCYGTDILAFLWTIAVSQLVSQIRIPESTVLANNIVRWTSSQQTTRNSSDLRAERRPDREVLYGQGRGTLLRFS